MERQQGTGRYNFTRIAIFLCLAFCEAAIAGHYARGERAGWNLNNAQLGAVADFPRSSTLYGGTIRWAPELRFPPECSDDLFGVGVDLGVAVINPNTNPIFNVSAVGFWAVHFDIHWDARLFFGAEAETGGFGSSLCWGGKLIYHFGRDPGPLYVDGVYASVIDVLSSHPVDIASVGIVFRFADNSPSRPETQWEWSNTSSPPAAQVAAPPRAPLPAPLPVPAPVPVPPRVQPTAHEEEMRHQQEELATVVHVRRTDRGFLVNLGGDLNFNAGSSALSEEGKRNVARAADILARYTRNRIRVEGHTDGLGAPQINQTLSLERAENVKAILIERGVKPENIVAFGIGSKRPVADNRTEEGRTLNRRVEIYIDTP